ncbi:MAG: TolB family protein, partial [Gemmatimonadaceae bacterium]
MRSVFARPQHVVLRLSSFLVTAHVLFAQQPGLDRSPAKPGADPVGALPYDLAFDARTFPWSMALSVSPDGRQVAYSVIGATGNVNRSERFQPNGTPSSLVGTKVQLTNRQTGRTVTICPGGNCWAPSLSPNGNLLAFYSDRDGPPQLWLHDVARGETRKLSQVRVKAKLWSGDEPEWSPNGTSIFVPTAPDSGPGAWLPTPKTSPVTPSTGLAVRVLRAGGEATKPSGAAVAAPLQQHYYRENNAALAAVDVGTGALRVLVPAHASPRPSVLRLSASGRWLSYLSTFKDHGITNQVSTFDLAVLPVTGGSPVLVAADLPLLGDYHKKNYAWHPSDDRLVYFKDGGLWLVDVASTGVSSPRRLGESLGPLAPTHHWFTRDGAAIIAGADPLDDKGYADPRPRALALVPMDGSPARRIPIDSAWVFDDLIKADARTVWQPEPGTVTALLTERATGERAAVRFDLTSGQSRVLWKGRARVSNLTGDASHSALVGVYQDVDTPPDVYRFPATFAARERVSHIDPRFE